jgi:AraC family transcriptional regulator of arabinose operon
MEESIAMHLTVDLFALSPYYGKVFCEKAWKWNTVGRPFDDYDLWYVWSGEGELTLNDKHYTIGKGSCFLFRPEDETIGSHNPQKPITVSFIHFSLTSSQALELPAVFQVQDMPTFELYFTRYVHARMENKPRNEEEAKLLLVLLLLQLEREQAHNDTAADHENERLTSIMHEVANYVRHFPSMAHSVSMLAERARLSPRYFSRKFKEIIGQTVESFIIECKIARAENLLRFNGMNVTEVAEALGYRNIYFFSRQFKKMRGINPSELRDR